MEGPVSTELVARLNVYPKMRAVLGKLPPKTFKMTTPADPPASPVKLPADVRAESCVV